MLQLRNSMPFQAKLMLLADADGVDTVFTVIKGTFTIGERFGVAEEQVPIALADQHWDDPATSSIRMPSDVSLTKPGTDVMLVGSAWAPEGRPVWEMDVSLAVGPVAKTVRVFGDRVWDDGPAGAAITRIAPFVRMPLVWERAYGGFDRSAPVPALERRNPVGTGFRARGTAMPLAGLRMPNVEDPEALITAPGQAPPPAGFGPIAPGWLPRSEYAGTYDDAWQQTRAPYLPSDFDPRFLQVAPPGLVTSGKLRGGELVDVRGATPAGVLRFLLPVVSIRVVYQFARETEERAAVLETVQLEPDEGRLIMVWRAGLACDKRALKVREVRTELLAA